jgi:hypothetical protein
MKVQALADAAADARMVLNEREKNRKQTDH